MIRSNRGFCAFAAAALSAVLLVACSGDPLTASLRPTADDKAASKNAPAGAYGALLRVGEATRQAGDPASAVIFFRKAHAADMFKPEALVKLGLALSDLGQYNDAAQAFRDALDLAHNNTEALRGLGGALIALNQPEIAADQFKAANAIEPDYRNFNGLGVSSDHLGRHKEAQQYYESGIKLYPSNLTLLNNLGLSQILSRDYDAAIATLVSAAQQPGATARQRQNLALAYGIAGRDADAERIARLDLDRQSVQSNLAYYGILRAAGDEALLTAVFGIHPQATSLAPAGGAGTPATIAPQAGTGSTTSAPAEAPKQPGPESRDAAPVAKPEAAAEPDSTGGTNMAAVQPAAGQSHPKKTAAKTIAGTSKAQQSGGSPQPAATADAAQTATTQPHRPEDTNASAPPASTHEAAATGTAAAQASEILNSEAAPAASAEEPRALQTAAEDKSAVPTAVIAGRYGQASVIAPDSAMAQPAAPTAAKKIASTQSAASSGVESRSAASSGAESRSAASSGAESRSAASSGAESWYAAPDAPAHPAATNRTGEIPDFLVKLYDFFFKPMTPSVASASSTEGPGANAAQAAALEAAQAAALEPAAGAVTANVPLGSTAPAQPLAGPMASP